jgi:hypothetical protein
MDFVHLGYGRDHVRAFGFTLGHIFKYGSGVQFQTGHARNSHKVPIERKNAGAVFQRNGCDERVNCAGHDTFSSPSAVDRGRAPVGVKSRRFQEIPLCQETLNRDGIPPQTLQNLSDYDPSQSERLTLLNHPPQFSPSTSG